MSEPVLNLNKQKQTIEVVMELWPDCAIIELSLKEPNLNANL